MDREEFMALNALTIEGVPQWAIDAAKEIDRLWVEVSMGEYWEVARVIAAHAKAHTEGTNVRS